MVDREFLAKELGFQSVAENSLWGVGDRDFIVEFLMWSSLAMTHISRMAEDLVVYSTAEFGFVTLSDAYRYVCRRKRMTNQINECLALALASCLRRKTLIPWNSYEESLAASLEMCVQLAIILHIAPSLKAH